MHWRILWSTVLVLLTVLSWVAMGNCRFRSGAVVVHSLNFDLIWHKGGRSRHHKLGDICHRHWGPIPIPCLLPPHHLVVQPWTIRLQTGQRLERLSPKVNTLCSYVEFLVDDSRRDDENEYWQRVTQRVKHWLNNVTLKAQILFHC